MSAKNHSAQNLVDGNPVAISFTPFKISFKSMLKLNTIYLLHAVGDYLENLKTVSVLGFSFVCISPSPKSSRVGDVVE